MVLSPRGEHAIGERYATSPLGKADLQCCHGSQRSGSLQQPNCSRFSVTKLPCWEGSVSDVGKGTQILSTAVDGSAPALGRRPSPRRVRGHRLALDTSGPVPVSGVLAPSSPHGNGSALAITAAGSTHRCLGTPCTGRMAEWYGHAGPGAPTQPTGAVRGRRLGGQAAHAESGRYLLCPQPARSSASSLAPRSRI